ncbi:MAG: E3 ubiquitin-protein ligase rad18 [Pleopsidium flavum]|nr:MAG: E3 ubiquitin-protein ligase rad18 [Pleopsidium flavum]
MDRAYDVPDSTDWLPTQLSTFAPVEAAMRCQVCKDFYDTPMMTSCCHTFCSICIRRCLTSDGKCPTCRAEEQEIRLRRNWTVQELVDSFRAARPNLLHVVRTVAARDAENGTKGLKRKLSETGLEVDGSPRRAQSRRTRSQSRRSAASQTHEITVIEDDEDDVDYKPGLHVQSHAVFDPNSPCIEDGFAACPICEQRMQEEDVYQHLDVCQVETAEKGPTIYRRSGFRPDHPSRNAPSGPTIKSVERLPKLNYSLLRENTLKKKLGELGIPSWGPKSLMTRRHTEWVNLWNANCDSSRPRPKRDLLQELDVWERSQGGHAPNQGGVSSGGSSLMRKDFDGAGWAANHDADFKQLIVSARAKRSAPNARGEAMTKEINGLSEPLEVASLGPAPSSKPKPYEQESRYLSDQSSTHCRNQTSRRCSRISEADTDDGSLYLEKEASLPAGSVAQVESQSVKSVQGRPLSVKSGKWLEEACSQPSHLDRVPTRLILTCSASITVTEAEAEFGG